MIRSARTSRLVASELTAAETSGSRIASVTSVPLIAIGERLRDRAGCPSRPPAPARPPRAVSVRSTSRCSASQVAARYIAPVSRKSSPSRSATPRAVLDLPDPLGPSMATTSGRSRAATGRSSGGHVLLGATQAPGQPTDQPRAACVATRPSALLGSHRERQIADLAYRIVLDRDVLHVDPRVAHVGEQPRQRTRLVRDGDDDLAVVPGGGPVLAGDLPRSRRPPAPAGRAAPRSRARPRRP